VEEKTHIVNVNTCRRKFVAKIDLAFLQKSSHFTLIFFLLILTHTLHLHLYHKNNHVLRYYR
jgi:hypothetical protein